MDRRWLSTGVPRDLGVTEAELRSFNAETEAIGRPGMWGIIGLLLVANALYGLEDRWAFAATPEVLDAYTPGRWQFTGVALATLAASWALPRRSFPVAVAGGSAALWVLAHTLGNAGGPSGPWIGYLAPFILLSVSSWMQPWVRLGLLAWLLAVVGLGYLAPHPEYLVDPALRPQASHLLWVALLCFVGGSWADDVRLRLFVARSRLAAERAGLADQVATQTVELRRLVHQLQVARAAERAQIARDLHDDLGQGLTAARLLLRHAIHRYEQSPGSIGPNLRQVASGLDELTESTRDVLRGLRPAALEADGLREAITRLAERAAEQAGFEVSVDVATLPEGVPADVALTAWRCAQEALTNAVRHAQATQVTIRAAVRDGTLHLRVQDDGVGLPPGTDPDAGPTQGLVGMRERVVSLGGDVQITSGPGVTVSVTLPITPNQGGRP